MKPQTPGVMLLAILLISACAPATPPAPTPDVNVIYTSAARTVVAEFTLTAAAFSPTPEPPTETPTLTPVPFTATPPVVIFATNEQGTPLALCDSMTFGADVDVTIPDGTQMVPNQTFTKTWKIKNAGACAWGAGYGLVFAYAEKMSGKPQPLPTVVQVGEEVQVSVDLKAPDKPGEYTSAWQMTNAKGIPFGKAIFLKIVVK